MKISLILPVYNEIAAVDACLANLEALEGEAEILFADGGSTDGTVERLAGRRVLRCPKGRARQMNLAARQARGDVLWFSHCDSLLPRDALEQIAEAVAQGARFGCFHIGFDRPGLLMDCNAALSNLRVRLWRIAFGDQGIFLTRELFLQMDGFPDLPIMEDYELSRRVRRAGVPLRMLPGRIVTSGRRYQRPLRVMWQMFYLRCLYRAGADIEDIARRYRDVR